MNGNNGVLWENSCAGSGTSGSRKKMLNTDENGIDVEKDVRSVEQS